MNRPAIGQHPARIVLFDINPPFEILAGRSICDALENVLCVGSSLAGLSRIPLFGMYVLTTFPDMILPLTHVRNNCVRLYTALQDIRTLLDESLPDRSPTEIGQCLAQGLLEACRQFQRYIGNVQQASLNFNQLEVIVLTAHPGGYVQQNLKDLPSQVDLTLLKRILSVKVNSSMSESIDTGSQETMAVDGATEDYSGLVDMLCLECDQVSLHRFFYSWLTDTLSESEHLHVLLPPPTPADTELLIKCDVLEKMLNPQRLPCHNRYSLDVDASICKYVYPTPSKAVGMTVSIHKLKTVCSIPRSALCESVLFGLPLVAVPTACWTIDWEELETNQNNFNALCAELVANDSVLLLQLLDVNSPTGAVPSSSSSSGTSGTSVSTKSTAGNVSSRQLSASGYFIMIPSDNRTLLLKSVVSAELLLPSSRSQIMKPLTKESELCIQASLSQLDSCDHFNPLKFSTGLFSALKRCSLPKYALDKGWAAKRKIELKRLNKVSCVEPMVPSSPKVARPGNRLTANMWSNPLSNVVKKASKPSSRQSDNNSRQSAVKNNISKMSWKSGFVND